MNHLALFSQVMLNETVWSIFTLANAAPVNKLSGPVKARLLATLAGLLILGAAMMALAWLGARFTRRYMRSEHLRREAAAMQSADDWAKKPLVQAEEDEQKQ